MPGTDSWNPQQYDRFVAERSQPPRDLLAMVEPVPGGRAVDLGCGTGAYTVELHEHAEAATTLGLDTSAAMLTEAEGRATDGVTFLRADLRTAPDHGPFDVAYSSAVLHWVPDHDTVVRDLTGALNPGGQLAVTMPANFDHPSHTVAAEVLRRTEFAEAGGAKLVTGPGHHVNPPEHYAELLHRLGYEQQHVRLQVYGHTLESTAQVVEWTSGTLLTPVRSALANDPDRYERFVDQYRERLLAVLGEREPYFYPFKRILFWGRLAA
jgi:trans-aconitate 2-methyltransferase